MNSEKHINIAIDGPGGAGKSTVAKEVARRLGIAYLDTGAMYRGIGYKCLKEAVDPTDAAAVGALLERTGLKVEYVGTEQRIILDGEDVTPFIREYAVSKAASDASAIPAVRLKLVALQREIAAEHSVVLDGRDIGTYVLPGARYKFFLTAREEVRAKRRHDELAAKGSDIGFDKVLQDMRIRDANDSQRDFAPLKQAADAVLIDSSDMCIDDVVEAVVTAVKQPRQSSLGI